MVTSFDTELLNNTTSWPFEEARKIARSLNIKNTRMWKELRPTDIPCGPKHYYKDKWTSWDDFFAKKEWKAFNKNKITE
jgi:hypothetical protein